MAHSLLVPSVSGSPARSPGRPSVARSAGSGDPRPTRGASPLRRTYSRFGGVPVMIRAPHFGFAFWLVVGNLLVIPAVAQESGGSAPPAPAPPPALEPNRPDPDLGGPAGRVSDQPVKPMAEGPLHEAFLSPRKDGNPVHVDKEPPPPIAERPGLDPPSANAEWIGGYWEWDPGKKDFIWVTGTWRVPPPGRFWVNGYWKRDDRGWYRVPGFWSERRTDRIDYRKNGPPQECPDEDPGPPPSDDCFYIPGQYYPDGDGVVWKPGFWAKIQPGWSWVPAQWVRQPEGWTFQEGYWDRTLEDRGTLFAPAEVQPGARDGNTVYQPYTQISPQSYGLLYGAYGRPNSYYDGYPGCYYDPSGRYYAYAQYGSMGPYYGYLDYPYYGTLGYPYSSYPVTYGGYYGSPYYGLGFGPLGGVGYYGGGFGGYGGYGYGLLGGAFGLGYGGYGYGFGYPYYGYGGFGYPFGYGFGGFGFPYFGLGLGFGFGFPFFGFGGFGFPFFGFGGFGGFGGFHHHHMPFFPGGRNFVGNGNFNSGNFNNNRFVNITNNRTINRNTTINNFNNIHSAARVSPLSRGHNGVMPPPSSRPFGNPFHTASMTRGTQHGPTGANWNSGFNGVHHTSVQHTAARPAFG